MAGVNILCSYVIMHASKGQVLDKKHLCKSYKTYSG